MSFADFEAARAYHAALDDDVCRVVNYLRLKILRALIAYHSRVYNLETMLRIGELQVQAGAQPSASVPEDLA